ncbi:hypothetical protein AcW2_006119 [Taiwanofungus camphoratus]|nr:hypothetical protein AcW2_006119 [Antrodia cinnamomea]
MALSHSPRKIVPLASGDDWVPRQRPKSSVSSITKRVFFCGVVVEGSESGREIPPDVQDLVASLGEPLDFKSGPSSMHSSLESITDIPTSENRRRAMTNTSALADIIRELVTTERSYVVRLRTLKNDYADPLRMFSRNKDTAILPPYEAKTLFGNIDNLVPVNEAFLEDLEKMAVPNGPGVGDVALRHFKKLKGFEHYKQYYTKREEAQAIFEREMKKSSGFAAFVDRIKYSSADIKNRVGLRELLMEPVQRIPRYTLMFRTMIKHMDPSDPQRAALLEADEIASRIALAETDEQTKRAAIMYCLSSSIEDFPPALFSHGRRFIDCIDVEDVLVDTPVPSSTSSSAGTAGQMAMNLHCSLFLFDDKLMIVKRPGNGEKNGRALAGLDELERLARTGGLPLGKKKSGMSCKGVVDVTDVVATDAGGADIHLYLEAPPQDQNERWSGRPFRALSVVCPPSPINLDPTRTETDKRRFLDNLWDVQGNYRTKQGQSVVLRAEEREVENRGGRVTMAKTYFNVYTRTAFLQEAKKTKVVLHIDPLGLADPIPFGMRGPPLVIVRVQPLAGDLSRYKVTSTGPNDDDEEDIVQTARVPERLVHTIHQYGLFRFRTGLNSVPTTPTASTRSRAAIFGLDSISRNLFNTRPGSAMGDLFGGSTNGHKRSKTYASQSSRYTQTTTTGDSSFSRFSRSNSTTTVATTMSLMEDESMTASTSSRRSRSLSRAKKLIKKAKPPTSGGSESEPESSPKRRGSRSVPSMSPPRSALGVGEFSDGEDSDGTALQRTDGMGESERDLAMRLELARRNSKNQHELPHNPIPSDHPLEDTIYEDDPPNRARPFSRSSRELPEIPSESQSQRSTTPRPDSITPKRVCNPDLSPRRPRSLSRHSSERRPMGPRTPSPLPPRKSPNMSAVNDGPPVEADLTLETTLVNMTQPPVTPSRSPLPRSKRQPFEPTGNKEVTPRPTLNEAPKAPGSVEPLSIKKKTSVRTNPNTSPSLGRRAYTTRNPSKTKTASQSPRGTSAQTRISRIPVTIGVAVNSDDVDRLIRLAETTKEDLECSHRAVKRIKLENDKLRSILPNLGVTEDLDRPASRPSSPLKGFRTPQHTVPPMTKEAQNRMEEMRQLIGKRLGEGTPRSRAQSILESSSSSSFSRSSDTSSKVEQISGSIDELVTEADYYLSQAVKNQPLIESDVQSMAAQLKEKSTDLDRTKVELQNTKRQCELVKSLLADCTAEKEILYEAFNEELDGMFNDANLPEDEAWSAMTKDLRKTKETRNALSRENSHLKRRLQEVEMQKEEWGALLRAHGLIP